MSEAVGRLLGRLDRGGKVPAADFTPFYLTAPNERLYRAAMDAFVQAKRRFTVQLRPEDARESIGGAAELLAIADALTQLVEWGNLRADPDTSRVTTVEDSTARGSCTR